ncbi:Short-chain dehydrogenase/reductase SDR [Penicillium canescens]|nr:Short-chain dehydrogenase/reductase SDR [Penicillium canescens]
MTSFEDKVHITTTIDVRNGQSVAGWIKSTVEKMGKLDGAVNMAGVITRSAFEMGCNERIFVLGHSAEPFWAGRPFLGFRAMKRAAKDGDNSMVQFLLDSKDGLVPPVWSDIPPAWSNIPTSWDPIHLALRNGHNSTVKVLLAYRKFDIDARDPSAFGRTSLHEAAINGLDEIVALLFITVPILAYGMIRGICLSILRLCMDIGKLSYT